MLASKHIMIKYTFVLLVLFFQQSVLAAETSTKQNTYLEVARTQLSLAYENYNKGDIKASKKNLQHAIKWLSLVEQHSPSEKVKSEAKKLAAKIDDFRSKLNKSSGKSDLARFWHQATSLIMRESEHLIHSYIEQSTLNEIAKHLLNAKLHFYTAEHDLFVSHDSNDATLELDESLHYLAQAEKLAMSEKKVSIKKLTASVNELKSLTAQHKDAWKQNALIQSLDSAIENLNKAESVASPPTRMKIESIQQTITDLKKDMLLTSLRVKYDSIMSDFVRTVNNIK